MIIRILSVLMLASLLLSSCDELIQEGSSATEEAAQQPDMPARKNFSEADMQYQGKSIRFTRHGRCRSECRQLDPYEIQEVINKGLVNHRKSDPNGKPCPSVAIDGRTSDGQQARVVLGTCEGDYRIITVIDLKNKWRCSCK